MYADGNDQHQLTARADFNPAWSPDGTKIAFARYINLVGSLKAQIFVMDADGSNQHSLTNLSALDERPYWSPDGTKIIFQSDRTGNNEIFMMNADGTNRVNISHNSSNDTAPTWQPLAPLPPPVISGRAVDNVTGAPLSGVLVTLSGDTSGSATTGANGAYSFTVQP